MSRKAANHLKASDPKLREIIINSGICKFPLVNGNSSPFEALAESITHQQLNGKAAKAIWQRLLDLYDGKRLGKPSAILKTPTKRLRAAGLSESKVLALRDLAEHADAGEIGTWKALEKLEDEEIMERLTVVRGIGPWTVQMLLIFHLGRPDVLPATDFGVQKGYQLAYGHKVMPKPRELIEAGEIWKPFRSYAAWYLWRAVELLSKRGK